MKTGVETLLGSGAVARRVKMPVWKLIYLVDRGDVPGPSYQVPGRRLFTERDVQAIVRALKTRPDLGESSRERSTRTNTESDSVAPE